MSQDYTIDTQPVKRIICNVKGIIGSLTAKDIVKLYMTILIILLLIIALGWLAWLTITFRRLQSQYSFFTDGMNRKTLDTVLTKVIKDEQESKRAIADLLNRYATIEKDGRLHIQKIGLLRFNPFKDTGGDQSFILTLADANDTGVVITALYSRSGTRWYAKRVVRGEGLEHELSAEEKKALKVAQNT
jgi:hypothetical protein